MEIKTVNEKLISLIGATAFGEDISIKVLCRHEQTKHNEDKRVDDIGEMMKMVKITVNEACQCELSPNANDELFGIDNNIKVTKPIIRKGLTFFPFLYFSFADFCLCIRYWIFDDKKAW